MTSGQHDKECQLCGTTREREMQNSEIHADMIDHTRTFGFEKIGVVSDDGSEPDFAYTVGLSHTFNHPDLVIFGLDLKVAFAILDIAQGLVEAGTVFSHGSGSLDLLDGVPVTFLDVSPDGRSDHLEQATSFYQTDNFPALMIVWPGASGSYPWSDAAPTWLTRRQPALWTSLP